MTFAPGRVLIAYEDVVAISGRASELQVAQEVEWSDLPPLEWSAVYGPYLPYLSFATRLWEPRSVSREGSFDDWWGAQEGWTEQAPPAELPAGRPKLGGGADGLHAAARRQGGRPSCRWRRCRGRRR